MWEYASQMIPIISSPIPEAIHNVDCLTLANTPEQYVKIIKNLHFIKKHNYNDEIVKQKILKGKKKSIEMTWDKSAELMKKFSKIK